MGEIAGDAMATAVTLVDGLIVIGGGISAREDFVPAIQEAIDAILERVKVARIRPDVRTAEFGNDANLIGAVRHFLQTK